MFNYETELLTISHSISATNPFTRLSKQTDSNYYSSKNNKTDFHDSSIRNSISLINLRELSLSGNNMTKSTINHFYSDYSKKCRIFRRFESEPCLSILSHKYYIPSSHYEYDTFDSINSNTSTKRKSFYDFDGYEAYKRIGLLFILFCLHTHWII